MAQDTVVKNEIATIDLDITVPVYGGVLRPTDDTLLTRGGGRGIRIYDDIERDTHAYAVLQKRKMALVSREYNVEAASSSRLDKKAAELVRSQLKNLACRVPDDEILPTATGFDAVSLNLLDATLKGFAVGEIMWQTDGSEIVAAEVRPKDQRRFEFSRGATGYRLNLKTWSNFIPGEPVPPRKFIVHSFGAKDGAPHGLGLGTRLFWPVFFKKQDITFWLTFVDKFASPTPVGEYQPGTDPAEQTRLLNSLRGIAHETGIIIPAGTVLRYLEAQRGGSIDTYEKLARYMDEQISECVLGETGSTNQHGSGGSRARDQVGNEVRLELVQADADLLSGTINCTLIKWITAVNLPGANPPRVWREVAAPQDLKAKAERDAVLTDKCGVYFSQAYFEREYAFQEGDVVKVQPPVAPSPSASTGPPGGGIAEAASFADAPLLTPAQQSIENLKANAIGQAGTAMDGMLKQVKDIIEGAASFEEAKSRLATAYGDMDETPLGELLARAIFAAQVTGRIDAGPLSGAEG